MVQEWELIEDRFISGSGVLKVPVDATRNRMYILYSDVVRDAKNKYLNLEWNPKRSRYGNIVFLRKNYVVGAYPVEYPRQCFDGINDISGQTLEALKCSYAGLLESIYNLAVALSGTPGGIGLNATTIDNSIADFTFLRLSWDELRVKCYADTALQLRLYRLRYDGCIDAITADIDAPIPDPPKEKIPSGQSIGGFSPPYVAETQDDGNSILYPGDTVPPRLKPCWALVGYSANSNNVPGTDVQSSGTVYPSWIRADTVTVSRFLIPDGFYAGCYGFTFVIDGVTQPGFGANLSASPDPNNPNCPMPQSFMRSTLPDSSGGYLWEAPMIY